MVYKQVKIKNNTDELLDKCVYEFLRHNKKMREIKISRNKIIYEIARFYLET